MNSPEKSDLIARLETNRWLRFCRWFTAIWIGIAGVTALVKAVAKFAHGEPLSISIVAFVIGLLFCYMSYVLFGGLLRKRNAA